jgi:hypothetical protein
MSTTRDELRAKLLASRAPTSKAVTFFGEKIEIRQPTLGAILAAREQDDRESAIINTLIMYAYVPGTDELVFEDADIDALKGMPFGGDFVAVSKALEDLTTINFLDQSKPSDKTPSDGGVTESPPSSDGAPAS